ncbi:MAG: hypothetical protein FK734_12190 [Asgard group archaeon]|nr:hypothetical protein [Asgard group archaeon]
MSDVNRREYLVLPIDYCYFDRERFDKLKDETDIDIVSYRKYENGVIRAHFITKEHTKDGIEERQHLLWIQLVSIENKQHVKYCCDCKYFEYRQIRPAKRLVELKELKGDLCAIIPQKAFAQQKQLFNIDKHAFLALKEFFNINIQISIQ